MKKTAASLPFFLSGIYLELRELMVRLLQITLLFLLMLPGTVTTALELNGEWQQGGVIIGKVPQGTQVEHRGKKLQISPAGEFVIGLGRDAAAQASLVTIAHDGARKEHRFAVKQRTYKIQKVTGVPQQTVEPDPAQVERAKREAQMAADARKGDLPLTFFAQKFEWPLIGPVTGVYGSQRFYNGVPNSPHYGVDIAKPVGTLVKAPAGGVVTLVHPDMFFSGGTLIIDHGHGLSSTFIHLSEVLVKTGDAITQGQAIAKVGKTGRATGPHLDWRMNWFEERVDPQLLVAPMPAE
ncbi:MAG: peptidase [Cellvibrio sp.]|jgi:murein DD-endopeptidase MepM/ murein hydrolase activator NlpD|nr:peptidase [Cellvibrio sp.]